MKAFHGGDWLLLCNSSTPLELMGRMSVSEIDAGETKPDVSIKPFWRSPRNRYYVRVVYRSQNVDKILSLIERIGDKMLKIIDYMEKFVK